tara:strand:- start:149 stop:679 length:531 start_codon:yes stop_codon:yes gene_type:complete
MKINVEIPSKMTGYTTLSPIDNSDEYVDEPYCKDINIKIDEYGHITINGEIMVMLKAIINYDHTVYCNFSDSKLNEKGEFVPAPPSGGISVGIGENTSDGIKKSDNMELFYLWEEEYGDGKMWTEKSFKELFKDLIDGQTNGKYIWRKNIEKARKFIMDSFDEVLNDYKDYEDNSD